MVLVQLANLSTVIFKFFLLHKIVKLMNIYVETNLTNLELVLHEPRDVDNHRTDN